MSNAIAQSATQLSTSNVSEENYPYQEVLSRIAKRKVGNAKTLASAGLKRSSLLSSLCNDYRGTYAAIYPSKDQTGKHVPLPAEVYDKLCTEVDLFLEKMLHVVNSENIISHRRAFFWKRKQQEITVRETIVGENIVDVNEQIVGINAYISDAQRSKDKIDNQSAPLSEMTEKRLKQLEKTIAEANQTLETLQLKRSELNRLAAGSA